jgi:hypothetical protein
VIDDFGRRHRVYKELPSDEDLSYLTYDPEILELMVWDKIMFDRPAYRNPDEFQDYDRNVQMQGAIWEHIMRYAGLFAD